MADMPSASGAPAMKSGLKIIVIYVINLILDVIFNTLPPDFKELILALIDNTPGQSVVNSQCEVLHHRQQLDLVEPYLVI